MKLVLIVFVAATLFQRDLNPNILTERMAAQIASDYAELKLRHERPEFHSTKDDWSGVFSKGRWQMHYVGRPIIGWHVSVSFKADASDRRIEGFEYSDE